MKKQSEDKGSYKGSGWEFKKIDYVPIIGFLTASTRNNYYKGYSCRNPENIEEVTKWFCYHVIMFASLYGLEKLLT